MQHRRSWTVAEMLLMIVLMPISIRTCRVGLLEKFDLARHAIECGTKIAEALKKSTPSLQHAGEIEALP